MTLLKRTSRKSSALSQLESAAIYADEIEKMYGKSLLRGSTFESFEENISPATAAFNQKKLSKLLAKEIKNQSYEFSPARYRTISWREKKRGIYLLNTTDRIVHGAAASLMNELLEQHLPATVYSYRRSRHRFHALGAFTRYVRRHLKVTALKDRGLYVFRGDVKNYADSVPVGKESPLWPKLKSILELTERDRYWNLIEQLVRVEVLEFGEGVCSLWRGVATGSPVSNMLLNLYLLSVDSMLSHIKNGFYARYGDDILFAHPDPETTLNAIRNVEFELGKLGLSLNQEKKRMLFFNGAGRSERGWKGSHQIEFLGCTLDFKGGISLGKIGYRMFIRSIKTAVAKLPDDRLPSQRGTLACKLVNSLLRKRGDEALPEVELVFRAVTDRGQLKKLDYEIALCIAEKISGVIGARAFREVPYAKMRRAWGLKSLVNERNRSARTKTA